MNGSQQGLWLLQALVEGQILEKLISLKGRHAFFFFGCSNRWMGKSHPVQQRNCKEEDKRIHMVSPHSQSTQGFNPCHPAGTTPCCPFSGSVQDGVDGSPFAGRQSYHLTLILESPLVACRCVGASWIQLFPSLCKLEKLWRTSHLSIPLGIPPDHPTHILHPYIPASCTLPTPPVRGCSSSVMGMFPYPKDLKPASSDSFPMTLSITTPHPCQCIPLP